tara:strand:- start:1997 stop:2746 length:750 start_codon:yes stop_codon:yes gene_type:complete
MVRSRGYISPGLYATKGDHDTEELLAGDPRNVPPQGTLDQYLDDDPDNIIGKTFTAMFDTRGPINMIGALGLRARMYDERSPRTKVKTTKEKFYNKLLQAGKYAIFDQFGRAGKQEDEHGKSTRLEYQPEFKEKYNFDDYNEKYLAYRRTFVAGFKKVRDAEKAGASKEEVKEIRKEVEDEKKRLYDISQDTDYARAVDDVEERFENAKDTLIIKREDYDILPTELRRELEDTYNDMISLARTEEVVDV